MNNVLWKKCQIECNPQECTKIPKDIQKMIDVGYADASHPFGKFVLRMEKSTKALENITQKQENITLFELLETIILNHSIDIKDFLDEMSENTSMRGNLYQSLWITMLLLDQVPEMDSSRYTFLFGKIEDDKFMTDISTGIKERQYLIKEMKVNMGNKVGVADISLLSKELEDEDIGKWACEIPYDTARRNSKKKEALKKLLLISSKYYTHEKTISNYDVDNIVHAMEVLKKKGHAYDYKIALFVRDKQALLKKIDRTTKLHIVQDIENRIYDIEDLKVIVNNLRASFPSHTAVAVANSCLGQNIKPSLIPKFHQLLFVKKTLSCIHQGQKLFLWGQIARSGKTYTSGTLISSLYKSKFFDKKKPGIVLVITPAPTETMGQFIDELFLKFSDFDGFDVYRYDGRTKNTMKAKIGSAKKPVIVVTSKQFLQGDGKNSKQAKNIDEYEVAVKQSIEEKLRVFKKNDSAKDTLIDLVVFDEVHYGGTTQISQWILKNIDPVYEDGEKEGKVIKVFLTATYKKPVDIFKIKQHQLLTWGLDDIEYCKYIANDEARQEFMDVISEKYGTEGVTIVEESLAELQHTFSIDFRLDLLESIEREYRKFPTLHVMTSLFDVDNLAEVMKQNVNNYNFDFNNIFATVTEGNNKKFINEESVINLLEYIADFSKETGILRRIRRTFIQYGQDQRIFFSQLWFLPYFIGNRIADVASTLKNVMEQSVISKWYNKYNVYIADDKSDKQSVKVAELKARREGKKGLIILVGKKFSLGVSLPCVDAVMFLNNDHNVDDLYQRMFRALTESYGKKMGILVDLNPYRSITTLLEYTTPPKKVGQVQRKEDLMESVRDATTRKIWLLDSDLMYVSGKHQKSYSEIYSRIKDVIDLNYLTEQLEKTKKNSENAFKNMLDVNQTILEDFLDIRVGKKGKKMLLLQTGKQPNVDGKESSENGEKSSENSKKPIKEAKKPNKKKENTMDVENKKKLLAEIFGDLCVLFALLLPDKCMNMSFQKLCLELTKVAECIMDKNTSISSSNSSSKKRDVYGLKDLWQTTMDKFGTVLSASKDEDGLCKKTYSLVKKYFANENILSSDINRSFDEMKRHVVDIDEKDVDKIHSFVEKYLTPKEYEKKAFGEVFTPLSLVREMLEAIPKYADADFWKNHKSKILDPAAGIGNFPLIAYELLMDGLKRVIPDASQRKRHILENMLYMVELNPNNVRLMRKIFGGKNYKLNIIRGDFLKDETQDRMKKEWGVEKYDLVMGNPPFQGQQKASGKRGGGDSIWDDFVVKSIDMSKYNDKSLICLLHPPGWRKPQDGKSKYAGLFDKMTMKNTMLYLQIHGTTDGQRVFRSGTKYDWYVLRKGHTQNYISIIVDEKGKSTKINLQTKAWLPNHSFKQVFELVAKKNEEKCEVIYSRTAYGSDKSWVKDDEWIEKNKESAKKQGYKRILIHSTPKSGVRYMWTNDFTKDVEYGVKMFGVPKVVFGTSGVDNVCSDKLARFGLTQHAIGLRVDTSNHEEVINFIKSSKFNVICNACSWSSYMLDWRAFTYFKKEFWKNQ